MTSAGRLTSPVPWLMLLALGAFWLTVVHQLGAQWSVYEQYNYGWAVPFLCLYLFWKRWRDRPAAILPSLPLALLGIGAAALLFLPTRLIEEASPTWRVPSWAMAVELTGITMGVIYLAGGKAWLKHFAFPVTFFLVAVPWPSQLESVVVQTLMRANTGLVVEFLTLSGIPALQHGNVIEVSTGMVGIEEACSGIRSLQATLMISLFFGELYRLPGRRRLGLVLAGAALAFACNLARTSVLVWVCNKSGPNAMEKWHDSTGISILLVCFTALWLVSLKLRRPHGAPSGATAEFGEIIPRAVVSRVAIRLVAWFLVVEAGTQVWFRSHEARIRSGSQWSMRWPADKPGLRNVEISPTTREILKFNDGKSVSGRDEGGSAWQMFFFRWGPARTLAERVLVQFAKSHRPEICLPAAGLELKTDRGIRMFEANGVALPFHEYYFEDHGLPLHVYFCAWEDGTKESLANMRENSRTRLTAAWTGNRSLSQRVLEIAVWGFRNATEADAAFQRHLEETIIP